MKNNIKTDRSAALWMTFLKSRVAGILRNKKPFFLILPLFIFSCSRSPEDAEQLRAYPLIYPDYTDITIPCNIAPLNFRIEGVCNRSNVILSGNKREIKIVSGNKVRIPLAQWRHLLNEQKGGSIQVKVTIFADGKWVSYKPFSFFVSPDSIDRYLSYRLIEPGYEVWNKLQLAERDLSTFSEKIIADNNLLEGGCINCHIYASQDPSASFFHLRQKEGGTMVWKDGIFRKLDTRTDSTISAGVYGSWHPSKEYIAFSTNAIIPAFHSYRDLRLEVYDTVSDIIIADPCRNEIITNSLISGKNSFETFPAFSADGSRLYFCSAKAVRMPEAYESVRYSLCSIDFYPETASFGKGIDTLVSSEKTGKTISEPKVSPDGKYILFTSFDYGNFPVWHREADLHLLNLADNSIDTLPLVNSDHADSYHSWSSNSRWIVFASKRDNGMYGKIYLTHIDSNGITARSFVLPQRDPDHYAYFLKSFNIPELAKGKVKFSASDAGKAFRNLKAEKMVFVRR